MTPGQTATFVQPLRWGGRIKFAPGDEATVIETRVHRVRVRVAATGEDGWVDVSNLVPFVAHEGAHRSHCCSEHGCKYSNASCPVETGKLEQDHPCESCHEDDFDSETQANDVTEVDALKHRMKMATRAVQEGNKLAALMFLRGAREAVNPAQTGIENLIERIGETVEPQADRMRHVEERLHMTEFAANTEAGLFVLIADAIDDSEIEFVRSVNVLSFTEDDDMAAGSTPWRCQVVWTDTKPPQDDAGDFCVSCAGKGCDDCAYDGLPTNVVG